MIDPPVSPEEAGLPTSPEEAGAELFALTTRRGDWLALQEDTRRTWIARALGDNAFIPPSSSLRMNGPDPERADVVPDDDAEEVDTSLPVEAVREPTDDEVPGGAMLAINRARKAGFELQLSRTQGPWGIVIGVQGRKDGRGSFAATWQCKPWTKDGTKFKYVAAHIWPRYRTGGLHNSKALNDYLGGKP
jgi:hypothetical protein